MIFLATRRIWWVFVGILFLVLGALFRFDPIDFFIWFYPPTFARASIWYDLAFLPTYIVQVLAFVLIVLGLIPRFRDMRKLRTTLLVLIVIALGIVWSERLFLRSEVSKRSDHIETHFQRVELARNSSGLVSSINVYGYVEAPNPTPIKVDFKNINDRSPMSGELSNSKILFDARTTTFRATAGHASSQIPFILYLIPKECYSGRSDIGAKERMSIFRPDVIVTYPWYIPFRAIRTSVDQTVPENGVSTFKQKFEELVDEATTSIRDCGAFSYSLKNN